VNRPADALRDPHIVARGTVQTSPGLRTVRPPFLEVPAMLSPAPSIGEHTDEVLKRLQ
jgi:crotonobetainyl-CoA:carnitine CoA-transferase CaiB-like acyl-CoA transferase